MESKTFKAIVQEINEKRISLLGSRGEQYAKEFDQLTSFKEVAAIWNILHPEKMLIPSNIAELLVILKQIRDANLSRQDANPLSEKREDTILDYHNYLDLKLACEIDELQAQ